MGTRMQPINRTKLFKIKSKAPPVKLAKLAPTSALLLCLPGICHSLTVLCKACTHLCTGHFMAARGSPPPSARRWMAQLVRCMGRSWILARSAVYRPLDSRQKPPLLCTSSGPQDHKNTHRSAAQYMERMSLV